MGIAARPLRNLGNGVWEVPLSRGMSALIEECDVPLVAGRSWCVAVRKKKPHFYACGVINGKQMRLHRFILGVDDDRQVDHISGDTLDNRRCNLRIVSNVENNRNRRTAIGIVPYKGVSPRKHQFIACITLQGNRKYLGTFPTAIEAALAYDAAARQHFGAFAATNASLGLFASCHAGDSA